MNADSLDRQYVQAVGLASTIKGDMIIDTTNPISMMQEVVDYVEAIKAERDAALRRAEIAEAALALDWTTEPNDAIREAKRLQQIERSWARMKMERDAARAERDAMLLECKSGNGPVEWDDIILRRRDAGNVP